MRAIPVASGAIIVGAAIFVAVRARAPAPHEIVVPERPPSDRTRPVATSEPMPLGPPSTRSPIGRQPPQNAPPSDPDTIIVQRDPRSPDYDADKLLQASAGPPIEQFAAEPRDEAWATEREDVVKTLTLRRLREVDRDAKMQIECRTAMCRINVDLHDKAVSEWLGVYPLGCLAKSYAVVGPDPHASASGSGSAAPLSDYYLIFDQRGRSRAGFLEHSDGCARRHDEWLAAVRRGKAPWE